MYTITPLGPVTFPRSTWLANVGCAAFILGLLPLSPIAAIAGGIWEAGRAVARGEI